MDPGIGIGILGVLITILVSLVGVAVTVAVVWKVVVPLLNAQGAKQQLLQAGTPAQVRVVAARETGMSVNDRPMLQLTLEVQVPGRAVYQTHVQELVPLMAMGMLSNGQPLAARVDPNDPSKVAIDWSGRSAAPARIEQGGIARLLHTGMPGQARIERVEQLPMPPGPNGVVFKFSVQVQVPDGRPVYSVETGQAVPPAAMSSLAPGLVVPCKVDPMSPSSVVLDFWTMYGMPLPTA